MKPKSENRNEPKRLILIAILLAISHYPIDSEAKTQRSHSAISQFKGTHPCPAHGNRSGPCPGWIIDHIKPLDCGGLDEPSNMQWQTEQQAKVKDKWERKGCRTYARTGNLTTSDQPQSGYIRGPKGGCFTYTASGRKRYVAHSYCGG